MGVHLATDSASPLGCGSGLTVELHDKRLLLAGPTMVLRVATSHDESVPQGEMNLMKTITFYHSVL